MVLASSVTENPGIAGPCFAAAVVGRLDIQRNKPTRAALTKQCV
jgi:hypothetical protein